MHFVILGTDRPGTAALRLNTRPTHRDYLHATHEGITLCLAGPTLAADGETMTGSLIVVEADTLDAVERFAAGDPYRRAGLFAQVDIRPWNWTTGNPARP
jgi:uncharacterized protein YciI